VQTFSIFINDHDYKGFSKTNFSRRLMSDKFLAAGSHFL
jgi:hypothetical protein